MPDEKTIVARNAALLASLEIGCKGLDLVLAIIIANRLGRESFGLLNYAYGVGATAVLLPNFGLDLLTVRDVATDRSLAPRYLINGALVKCLLSPIALAGVLVFAVVTGRTGEGALIVMLGTLIVLSDGFLRFVNAFFRAHQVMQYEALVRAVLSIVNVGTGLLVLFTGGKLLELLLVRFGVYVAGVAAAVGLLHMRKLFTLSWRPRLSAMRPLVKSAAPFAVLATFTVLFVSIDIVMLGLLKGDAEVGIYAAARRLTFVVLLLASGFTESVLPAMARRASATDGGAEAMLRVSTRVLLIMALPIVGWFIWYAHAWIGLLFHASYARSAPVLAILALALLFDFMNHGGNRALIACRAEKTALKIVGGAAVFNIVTNWMLIPRYGAAGAALTTVATEALVFAAQTVALARRRMRVPLREIIRPLLAFVVMTGVLWVMLTLDAPWYVGAPAAGLAYLAALLCVGALSREEIAFLFSLVRSPGIFFSKT